MDGMNKKRKKRRHKPNRDTDEPTRSAEDHAQRSDVSGRPAAEAKRAQRARGSSGGATGLRRVLNLRLLIVLLIAAASVALYGMLDFQVPRNTSEQQDARVPIERGPSGKDALVPTRRGPSWKEMDDPAKDGWDTEVFASQAKKQLEALGNLLAHPGGTDAAAVANLITDDFACGPLRPANLITILDDQHLKIDRASITPSLLEPGEQPPGEAELPYRGADGLVQALRAAVDPFSGATDVRFEVKVFRVVSAPGEVSTRQYFSISGRTKSGTVEQHATWDIGWTPGAGGALPRMWWIRVEEFEQAECRQPNGALFADCTESVLGGNNGYADQFLRGMNYWFERIQDLSPFANPGLAVGDVNGDGLDDLYVCQEAGLPNRLFIQNADGSAREQSASWGVDWLESSRSALLVDLDNDSDQDLVVAILGGVVVAENDGQGRFRLREVLSSGDDTMSLSAVDYDMDGRLDIYVCAYFKNKRLDGSDIAGLPGAAADFVVHDANDGGNNTLFHNQISSEGTWRFTDVTGEVGLDANNHRYSFAAAWDDFDNDGDQDLYVANDYGRDHLYRNDLLGPSLTEAGQGAGRQFVDISDTAHIEDSATGMSVTWGDYDRDGWMDVLVSNMWSSAGQRITFQSRFKPEAPHEIKRRYQRLARGNTLLRNRGDGTFGDQSAPAAIEMGRWAWGSHFVDLNNDGWEDMIVSNGYITTADTGDL
jgi:hypothetical protein